MKDTPRTDEVQGADGTVEVCGELAEHARTLERDLTAMTLRCGQIDGLKVRIGELNLALDKERARLRLADALAGAADSIFDPGTRDSIAGLRKARDAYRTGSKS